MSQTVPVLNCRRATSQRLCADTSCNSYMQFDYELLTPVRGHLKVKILYARNLPVTDLMLNDPDPYVKVLAVKSDGNEYSKKTSIKQGTRNPTWNTWLNLLFYSLKSVVDISCHSTDKIADRSEHGWGVVQQFTADELTEDSDDEKWLKRLREV